MAACSTDAALQAHSGGRSSVVTQVNVCHAKRDHAKTIHQSTYTFTYLPTVPNQWAGPLYMSV